MKSYIYFIQELASRHIKIGCTINPSRRIRSLYLTIPGNIQVLGIFPGSVYLEKDLHFRFRELRVKGEWFKESDKIYNEILKFKNLIKRREESSG